MSKNTPLRSKKNIQTLLLSFCAKGLRLKLEEKNIKFRETQKD